MGEKKSNTRKLMAVLGILAIGTIALGTFGMLKYRDYMMSPGRGVVVTDDKEVSEPSENEPESSDSDGNVPDEDEDDPDMDENKSDEDKKDDKDEDDTDEEKDEENEDKDDDKDEDDDEDKDYVVMRVQAPDNFAAVRAGRGTQFQEVGRITNGHRVALTDLENGWYKIAKGKYKGYYTHQSSFVSE